MATQSNNLMLLDSSGFPRVIDTTNDTLSVGVDTAFTKNLSVGANLTVSGDIVARSTINLVVQDAFIDLGVGNTTTDKEPAGFSFNIAANRTSVTTEGGETITAMEEGVGGTSAPTLIVSGATEFSSGDILVLTGSSDGSNDGLYVVNSINSGANDEIVLKGVGGTAVNANVPWARTQVTALTDQSAKAYKADIAVMVIADGTNFPDGNGTAYAEGSFLSAFATDATEGDFTSNGDYGAFGAGGTNLQAAYNVGATINTEAVSAKPIQFNLGQDGSGLVVQGSTSGVGNVVFGQSGALINQFSVLADNAVSVNTTNNATYTASGVTSITNGTANQGFAIGHVSSGDEIAMSDATGSLSFDGSGALAVAGATTIDIDGSGALSLNSSTGVINIGNDTVNQNINVGTQGARTISVGHVGATQVKLDAGSIDLNAADAGSINIGTSTDGGSDTSPINVGTNAAARTITVGNAASTALNLNAADINVVGATTLDLDAGTIGIGTDDGPGGKTINIGEETQSNPITIDAGTSKFDIQAATDSDIEVNGSNGDGLTLNLNVVNGAGPGIISLDADVVSSKGMLELGQEAGPSGIAGENLSRGRVCVFKSDDGSPKVYHASADSVEEIERGLHLTSVMAVDADDPMNFGGVAGSISNLEFKTGINGSNIGATVYLYAAGATAADKGKVTLTPPTASGSTVFKVGIVASGTAVDTNYWPVLIQPQFIAKRP